MTYDINDINDQRGAFVVSVVYVVSARGEKWDDCLI